MGKKDTEKNQRAAELLRQGYSLPRIAEVIGGSSGSARFSCLFAMEKAEYDRLIRQNWNYRRIPDEEFYQILKIVEDCGSISGAARTLNKTKQALQQFLANRMGKEAYQQLLKSVQPGGSRDGQG